MDSQVVYEEPDFNLYREKQHQDIKLENCPAYGENVNKANQNVN